MQRTDQAEDSGIRTIRLGDSLELFQDPETETMPEGYAKVWEILEENDKYYVLVVSFLSDPKAPGRKFVRRYKRRR